MPRAIQPQPNRRIAIPTRRQVAGRLVLYLLTLIHLVLPWTLVNQNDSTTVLVGGMIIGIGFLVLALWSRRNPVSAFGIGAVLFLIVETVAAATGAALVRGLACQACPGGSVRLGASRTLGSAIQAN